jgi:hypothetical protein
MAFGRDKSVAKLSVTPSAKWPPSDPPLALINGGATIQKRGGSTRPGSHGTLCLAAEN